MAEARRRHRLHAAAPLVALALAGCPVEHAPGGEPEPLGSDQDKAVQACKDFVQHAAEMLQRTCEPNESVEDLAAVLEGQFEERYGGGCEAADGVRDLDAFYGDCLPAMDATETCLTDRSEALPEACSNQLQFVAE